MSDLTEQNYRIVQLVNGSFSVRSVAHGETFHPVVGPVQEAEALYLKQLRLRERLAQTSGEFVIWDVGLGAAANPVTVLRGLEGLAGKVRILSFDHTTEPLEFALNHTDRLDYLQGFEEPLRELLSKCETTFPRGELEIGWTFHGGDFPALLENPVTRSLPKPHAILYDAFSPAKNPTMWSLPLFERLFALLDPERPCSLPTYSRSTLLRVTLLLAGFYVGVGHATGEKEETTIAANTLELIEEPLDQEWLLRAKRSTSAEPLHEAVYRQAPLSAESFEKLQKHPQFRA